MHEPSASKNVFFSPLCLALAFPIVFIKLSFYFASAQLSPSLQSWALSPSMTINGGEGAITVVSCYLL